MDLAARVRAGAVRLEAAPIRLAQQVLRDDAAGGVARAEEQHLEAFVAGHRALLKGSGALLEWRMSRPST